MNGAIQTSSSIWYKKLPSSNREFSEKDFYKPSDRKVRRFLFSGVPPIRSYPRSCAIGVGLFVTSPSTRKPNPLRAFHFHPSRNGSLLNLVRVFSSTAEHVDKRLIFEKRHLCLLYHLKLKIYSQSPIGRS
jgi:hypothetical protein